MAIRVEFDEKLQQRLGGADGMEVRAATVHGALIQVAQAHPGLHMFNCEGELRSILRLHKNGEPTKAADPLADGDTVQLSLGA